MAGNEDDRFDSAKAERFEQLGHPLRIKIIEVLYASPLNFSALKAKMGIMSNGHLNFHLMKLKDLVSTNEAGEYYLTDSGRDSMRVASMIDWQKYSKQEAHGSEKSWRPTTIQIVGVLLVASLFVNAGLAIILIQQNDREMRFRHVIFNNLDEDVDDLWRNLEAGISSLIRERYDDAHKCLSYAVELFLRDPFSDSAVLGEGYQILRSELELPWNQWYSAYKEMELMRDAVLDGTVTNQQIAYLGGWMNAFGNLSVELYWYQNTDYVLKNSSEIAANFKQKLLSEVPSELPITEEEAVALARDFLESRGCGTGALISTEFALEHPNYYWHDVFSMEKPYWRLSDLFWIVSFEQEADASQYLEVWVNIYSGEIKGGGQGSSA